MQGGDLCWYKPLLWTFCPTKFVNEETEAQTVIWTPDQHDQVSSDSCSDDFRALQAPQQLL